MSPQVTLEYCAAAQEKFQKKLQIFIIYDLILIDIFMLGRSHSRAPGFRLTREQDPEVCHESLPVGKLSDSKMNVWILSYEVKRHPKLPKRLFSGS